MKEENKKRINKLIIPLTTKTLSILSAATIMTTGLAGCKDETKKASSDITASISSNSSEDTVSNDIVDSSIISSSEDILSSEEQSSKDDSSKVGSSNSSTSSSKPSNSTTTSSSSNSNSTSPSTNSTTSTPSTPNTPVTPSVPSNLTSANINNVTSIDAFADNAESKIYSVTGEALYTFVTYIYEGVKYDCGKDEFRFFITLLNNDCMNQGTITNMFSNKSFNDINRYSKILTTMCGFTFNKKANIKYDLFVVDQNKQNFLKDLQANSRDSQRLLTFVKEYYNSENANVKYGADIVIDYYVYLFTNRASSVYGENEFTSLANKYSSLYLEYNEYIESFYKKIGNRVLTK